MALPTGNDLYHRTDKTSLKGQNAANTTGLGGSDASGLNLPAFGAADYAWINPDSVGFAPAAGFSTGLKASGAAVKGSATALYLTEPGNTSPVAVTDLHQDGLGDCYLISSIGELVLTHPASITNMIQQNANGTETVTLYEASSGKLPTPGYNGTFKAVTEVVNNNFNASSVNSGATQDVVNGVKEIWPQVIEQAFAQLNGGISAISNGGYPFLAMEELTGKAATWIYQPATTMTGSQLFTTLQNDVKAGDMLTFDTVGNPAGYNLVGNHCYMFDGITGTGAAATVTLLNPWGTNQPGAIPLSKLAGNICQIDVGHA